MPDGRALFEFPMVLAPTLIVPGFVTMNAIQATVVWLQMRHAKAARAGTAVHPINQAP
jgi:cellobiose-specific phosphotransferase system component IIC